MASASRRSFPLAAAAGSGASRSASPRRARARRGRRDEFVEEAGADHPAPLKGRTDGIARAGVVERPAGREEGLERLRMPRLDRDARRLLDPAVVKLRQKLYEARDAVPEKRPPAVAGASSPPRPRDRKIAPVAHRGPAADLRALDRLKGVAPVLKATRPRRQLRVDLAQKTKRVLVVAEPEVQPVLDDTEHSVASARAFSTEPPACLIDCHALTGDKPRLRQFERGGEPSWTTADYRDFLVASLPMNNAAFG